MTISTTGNRVAYQGNGSTTGFSFPFFFFANSDIVVLLTKADGTISTKMLATDYALTGATNPAGGSVTMLVAPAVGETLTIYRDPAATQTTHWVDNDPLPAASIENAMDKLTTLVQRLRDLASRSFRLSDADNSGASTTLPLPTANKLIGWNSTGTALQNYGAADNTLLAAQLGDSASPANGTALIGYKGETLYAFLSRIISVPAASIAALRLVDKTKYNTVNVSQYYGLLGTTAPDGGGGLYVQDPLDTTSADDGGGVIVGVDGARWKLVYGSYVSLKQFGARGDNASTDDTPIANWIAFGLAKGVACYAPSGTYRKTTRMLVGLNGQLVTNKKFKIFGDGPQNTKFNLTNVPTNIGPQFHVFVNAGGPTASYPEFEDFNVYGSTPNVLAAFGLQNLSDNIGNMRCKNFTAGNDNAGASSSCMQVNYCFDCVFENCVSVNRVGLGRALDIRRADFCTFIGGSYSNADYGVSFRDDVSRGNMFIGVDIENVNMGIRNDFAGIYNNVFIGGFADIWRPDLSAVGTWLVSSPVGSRGCITLDNFHSTRAGVGLYAGGKYLDPSNPGAVTIRGYQGNGSPSMSANGATIFNTTGQTQNVTITGGTVAGIFIRGVLTGQTFGNFTLTPGDSIAIQYSVAPTWAWFPIY